MPETTLLPLSTASCYKRDGDHIVIESVRASADRLDITVSYGTDKETEHTFELIDEDKGKLRFKHFNEFDEGLAFVRHELAFDISNVPKRFELYVNEDERSFKKMTR